MRIKRVVLENWRKHRHLDLSLAPLTVVVGPNGAGKSSIANAIRWALTGRCEWTDARGAGTEWLVHQSDPSKAARVVLEVEGIGTIERQWQRGRVRLQVGDLQGSSTVQQDLLYRALGANADTLDGLLDVATYLWDLRPREQVEHIIRIGGATIPAADVAAHVREMTGVDISDTLQHETYTPDDIEGLYQAAYQQRRADRRVRDELEHRLTVLAQAGEAAQEPIEPLQAALAEAERERAEAEASLAALTDQAARAARLAAELRAVEDALRAAERDAQQAGDDPHTALQRAQRALNRKIRDLRRYELDLEVVQTQQANARSRIAQLEAIIAHPSCPLAAAGICQTPAEALAQAAEQAKLDLGMAQEQEREAAKQAADLRTRIHALRDEIHQLQAQVAHAEAAAERAQQAQARLADLRARYEDLQGRQVEGVAPDALEQARQRLQQAMTRVADLQARLRRAQEAARAPSAIDTVTAQLDEVRQRLAVAEAICEALAPAARARLLHAAAERVLAHVNAMPPTILSGASVRVEMEPEPHLHIRLGETQVPLAYLSESEQMRVGIAIQLALAHVTGVRCLVIDEVDRLDPDNRAALLDMLLDHRDLYDTVVILATQGDVEPNDPGIDGLAVYCLDAQGVHRAPATMGVAS